MRRGDDVSDTSDRVDVHLLSSVHGGSRQLSAKGRWHRTAPHWMGDHAVDTVRPASRTAVADRTEALTCVLSPTTGDDATDGLTAGEILPSSSSSATQPSPIAARGACDLNQLRLFGPSLARALVAGLDAGGLSDSASRMTIGGLALYGPSEPRGRRRSGMRNRF